LPRPHQNILFTKVQRDASTQQRAQKLSNENQIQLAIQATKQDANLTQRRAAAIYKVSRSTLRRRLAGKPSHRDCRPTTMKLTATEEAIILQRALDFDERGSLLQLAAVKEMADCLLAQRHQGPVGKHCANNFVQRQPELQVKFNQKYDYKRTLCEDPELLRGWFRLVQNMESQARYPG
jgi:transcriptional regulator with XRE-family HTH domain